MSATADRPSPDEPEGSGRRESTPRNQGMGARTPKVTVEAPDFVPLDSAHEQAAVAALTELLAIWLAQQAPLIPQAIQSSGGQARAA
jgi:hypothetical protein